MVKFALIGFAILAFQLALGVVLGKCIRAGRGPDDSSEELSDLEAMISRVHRTPFVVPPLAPEEERLQDWPILDV